MTRNLFGLTDEALREIRNAIAAFPDIADVRVFGSRALGNWKQGSDVDLALLGPVNPDTARELSRRLNEELPLPWKFDVLAYRFIESAALRAHIDEFGVPLGGIAKHA